MLPPTSLPRSHKNMAQMIPILKKTSAVIMGVPADQPLSLLLWQDAQLLFELSSAVESSNCSWDPAGAET